MKNRKAYPFRILHLLGLALLLTFTGTGCGKRSATREWINQPANGYISEVKTAEYMMSIQYQPPAYRADQEILLNHSKTSRSQLTEEYDNMQQFFVKYKMEAGGDLNSLSLTEKFRLVTSDTIPCADAHIIPYSPGSPHHEILLLFPTTEKEMGNDFSLNVAGFPQPDAVHNLVFHLKRQD